MKIVLHATASDPEAHAVVSLRIDGRQVKQIERAALTASQAMRAALADAIAALAVEEVRNAERVLRLAPSYAGRETPPANPATPGGRR